MIRLERGPIYTTFAFLDMGHTQMFEATNLIRQVTSARPAGYKFMPAYRRGVWDGYIRLAKGNRFPTGLCWDVADILTSHDYSVLDIRECEIPECDWDQLNPDALDTITLRDYQLQAAKTLLQYDRGVAKMATNAGKTAVIGAIARAVIGDVLILVTKKDVLYQTIERMKEYLGEDVGIVGDGKLWAERVTVGMIQTLVRRLKGGTWIWRTHDPVCVMFDECHHLPSKTAQQVMLSIPAPLRFGFSGTPLSYDKLTDLILIGATGPVRVDITNADLIAMGVSATPTVYMYEVVGMGFEKVDYHDAYAECIVNNPIRNGIIAEQIVKHQAESILVLVERIEHGDILNELIPNSIFVNGSDDMALRHSVLDALSIGDERVVIATPIFDEGVDVPAVDLLVLAGGGKGHKKLLQRVGRGMRWKERNVLSVIDFVDNTNKYLRRHSKRRREIYQQEGFEVVLK